MRKIKAPDFNQPILEDKQWPEGTIAKAIFNDRLGKYVDSRGWKWQWQTFKPTRLDPAQEDVFYIEIKKSGKTWIEGTMMFPNSLENSSSSSDGYNPELLGGRYQVRVDKTHLRKAGPEFKIFTDAKLDEKTLLDKKFFIEGTEAGILDITDGKSTKVKEGEYRIIGYNYLLTNQFKQPILTAESRSGDKQRFSCSAETFGTFGAELSTAQRTVIAEWFAKKLDDAEITLNGSQFVIKKWHIKASTFKGYPESFSAGPFVNKKQADLVLESIKKINKYSLFDADKAEVETTYSTVRLELPALIDWCNTIGVNTTMKQLLDLRQGAVTGHKFGL